MRLWHKDLIPYLPRQQLLCQWRECCAIAKSISETGTPNHILVNKIMDYPLDHFYRYCGRVFSRMVDRGFKADDKKLLQYAESWELANAFWNAGCVPLEELFAGWHNNRYLFQCFYNLQEKYDCGGIPEKEWKEVCGFMMQGVIDLQFRF